MAEPGGRAVGNSSCSASFLGVSSKQNHRTSSPQTEEPKEQNSPPLHPPKELEPSRGSVH